MEAAEDADKLGPGDSAETIQIKETAESGSITLRSESVLEAVNNHWDNQQKNPQYKVRMRYLTTSKIGKERPNPFGGSRGLDLWDLGKTCGDLKLIRQYLGKQKKFFSKDLLVFIQSSTDEEFRECLLESIVWDTGNSLQLDIEKVILSKLIAHGERIGYQYSEYETILNALLRYVWNVVLQKSDRKLTKADFLREFENAATERVDKSELRKLRAAAASVAPVPAQVQPAMSDFTGRISELQKIVAIVTPPKPGRINI